MHASGKLHSLTVFASVPPLPLSAKGRIRLGGGGEEKGEGVKQDIITLTLPSPSKRERVKPEQKTVKLSKLTSGVAVFLLVCFLSDAWAAENAAPQSPIRVEEEEFLVQFPLFYSYESGEWITSSPGKIFTTGNVPPDFTLPVLKGKPAPIRYPIWAMGQNWEGELVIALEVRSDGKAGRWKIMKSSGHEALDQAGVTAIRQWRFQPGRLKGKIIPSCIQIPVRFRID